jgi:hypothetical protein
VTEEDRLKEAIAWGLARGDMPGDLPALLAKECSKLRRERAASLQILGESMTEEQLCEIEQRAKEATADNAGFVATRKLVRLDVPRLIEEVRNLKKAFGKLPAS